MHEVKLTIYWQQLGYLVTWSCLVRLIEAFLFFFSLKPSTLLWYFDQNFTTTSLNRHLCIYQNVLALINLLKVMLFYATSLWYIIIKLKHFQMAKTFSGKRQLTLFTTFAFIQFFVEIGKANKDNQNKIWWKSENETKLWILILKQWMAKNYFLDWILRWKNRFFLLSLCRHGC